MSNLSLTFSNPWLLLLLIPAVALTLIPYFRLNKKYRKTRNRIVSMVLHMLVMVLCISVLAGMEFRYDIPNEANEIILLVDLSDTTKGFVSDVDENINSNVDDFVAEIIDESLYSDFKLGIVTFGFDQKYVVPLTMDLYDAYNIYKQAERPDTSATNIAAALNYAKDLFDNPKSGKIVLVTDGKETDESADTVIRSVAAMGIRVDVAQVSDQKDNSEVQLIGAVMPEYHVNPEDSCALGVNVQSNCMGTATLALYDNGGEAETQQVDLNVGSQIFYFNHTFIDEGLHELKYELTINSGDGLKKNNVYYSYLFVEKYNKVLILERNNGESEALKNLLIKNDVFNVDVVNLLSVETIPTVVDDLRKYDNIVLNNIGINDMPVGFDDLLYSYVNDFGGGVLTVGGDKEDGTANTYNRKDIIGSTYQEMLPVEVINYIPPRGVIVIIDQSGSMSSQMERGGTKLEWARAGAYSCLDALEDRDFFGLMTLESGDHTILPLTPRTQESLIKEKIDSIDTSMGGTVFPNAIDKAGQALRALPDVDKKHIIIVSDCEVPTNQYEEYIYLIKKYHETDGITLSVVAIGMDAGDPENVDPNTEFGAMNAACIAGGGQLYTFNDSNIEEITTKMREDLKPPDIYEQNRKSFRPIVSKTDSPIVNGLGRYEYEEGSEETMADRRLSFTLGGFYGGRKRSEADVIVVGEFEVPVYAQWKLGKGMVGSFMCDLNGTWSSEMFVGGNGLSDGERLIYNIINGLMPTENIRPNDIVISLNEGNYINQLSVYTALQEGESIKGEVFDGAGNLVLSLNDISNGNNSYVSLNLSESNNFSRCNFVLKTGGVYKLTLKKLNADGEEIGYFETFKDFSYSKEYDVFINDNADDNAAFLNNLATRGNGKLIADVENPYEIFEDFVKSIEDYYDPAMPLIITAIVLFLLDIAVRKFKFKWIHELVREYKTKKKQSK